MFPMRSGPSGGTVAALGFLLLPAAVILVSGLFVHGFEMTSIAVVLVVLVGVGASFVAARRTSAFLVCSVDTVVVGFAPYWRTTLRARAISTVDVIEVDAFAEYGGWGIKGGAREGRGRLYSAGGRSARLVPWARDAGQSSWMRGAWDQYLLCGSVRPTATIARCCVSASTAWSAAQILP